MATSISELVGRRPVDREVVETHKRSMRDAVRAFRLRELRQERNITQEQLAAILHVTQTRVSQIERGDIDRAQVETLRKYVEAVGGELHVEVKVGDTTYALT